MKIAAFANLSINNKKNKNNRDTNKQKQKLSLKGKTKYLKLIPRDTLYRQNLFKLTSRQYQLVLETILKDLNALLYFNQDDFFQQLEKQDSLRTCLQSCLVCLCKKPFYKNTNQIKRQKQQEEKQLENQYFEYYDKLNEIVLKIYFRISQAQKQQQKQIIYNSWLFDVPKMLDLSMTYVVKRKSQNSYSNSELIEYILTKAIQSNQKDYVRDFDDFINIIYQDKMPLILKDMQIIINLSQQAMKTAQRNFQNPLKSFLITSNKILFEIKDLFTTILFCYLCFPQVLKQKLATDHQILQDLLKIFIQFVENTPKWKISPYQEQFHTNFADIQRVICQCFAQNFKILKTVIQKGDKMSNTHYSRALSTYCVHCLYFKSQRVQKQHRKSYENMVTTLYYRFQMNQLFFLSQAPENLQFIKLSQEQKQCIKRCFQRQKQIVSKLRQIQQQQQIFNPIKKKIENFFERNSKKQYNRIQYCPNQQNLLKGLRKRLQEIQLQKSNETNQQLQSDESQLSLIHSDQDNSEENEQLELSFEALKSKKSNSDEEEENKDKDGYQRQQELRTIKQYELEIRKSEPPDAEALQALELRELMLSAKQYKRQNKNIESQQDDYEQLQQIKQAHYQSNRPQYGSNQQIEDDELQVYIELSHYK